MLSKIKFLTAGESHGKALIGIIQGIPSGLEISSDYINTANCCLLSVIFSLPIKPCINFLLLILSIY